MYEEGLLRREVRVWLESLNIIPNDLKIYIQSLTHRSFAKQINISPEEMNSLSFWGILYCLS
jgi:dsRNA-specific ribonuclease